MPNAEEDVDDNALGAGHLATEDVDADADAVDATAEVDVDGATEEDFDATEEGFDAAPPKCHLKSLHFDDFFMMMRLS